MASPPGGTVSLVDDPATATTSPAREALAPGDLVDGVYRIERLLGEGGSGAVFLVRHQQLGQARFALKVLHGGPERGAAALAREGRLAALVRSAHVVKVAALGRLSGGTPYLVMEYVDGPTLDQLLGERELAPGDAIDCGRQLCLALEAAHDQGLVHGNVSLRNVFATVEPDGRLHLQLGDFGLVRRVAGDASATVSVELSTARGTPRFMAPETVAAVDAVDQRADLFSVGVVMYRLLAGVYPFDGASAREIFTAILRGEPVDLAERKPDLGAVAAVVMRCLALDPAARFASARELRLALDAAPTLDAAPAARRTRGSRRAAWLAGGVALAGVAVSAVALRGPPHARTTIPPATALACPDTTGPALVDDPELAHALAQALCARVAATLDVDWGGGRGATEVRTRLERGPSGEVRVIAAVDGREEAGRGETPLLAAEDAARRLGARFEQPAMTADAIHHWGARDADSARAARTVWRQRTTLLLTDYERAPRAVLARDPTSPMMHLLLAEVDQDPARRRDARDQALANADRLPAVRAAALRGFVAVLDDPAALDRGLAALRAAYSSSPDDLEIAVLYTRALVDAGRADAALALIEDVHARFPRRAVLAVHHGGALPTRTVDEGGYLVEWTVAAHPEARAGTDNVARQIANERLDDARAALEFARRLGIPDQRLLLPRTVLALAAGEPEAVPLRQLGDSKMWSRNVGARMRLAALLLSGQAAAAATFIGSELADYRSSGDDLSALLWAGELLKLERRLAGPTLDGAQLDWLERGLAGAKLSVGSYAAVATELALARRRVGTKADPQATLAALEREVVRRAGTDGGAAVGAQLRLLPLVRVASGDGEAARRWRLAAAASHLDRVLSAFDAALALEAVDDDAGAEAAYRLAASSYSIERHPLEAVAARLRLVDLLAANGRAAERAEPTAYVDRVLAGADPGVRDRLHDLR